MELLKGKKGIITGALNDKSIAWKVAEHALVEGAEIVLTNTPLSLRMGSLQAFADVHGCPVIPADATSLDDLGALVDQAMKYFGGQFDFVLHSIGMSPNVRKGRPYETLDYGFLSKTLDISALSFHKLLHTLYTRDALREWGSVVALTYIAAERAFVGYNDMADAKALLQSITRSFGAIYGPARHVRINTVSQSPTATTAGSGIAGMDDMLRYAEETGFSADMLKLSAAVYLTLPGVPFVYYGEELGLSPEPNDRLLSAPSSDGLMRARTAFPWTEGQCVARFAHGYRSEPLKRQLTNPDSMLRFYRRMLRLRNELAPLRDGVFVPISAPDGVLAYRMQDWEEFAEVFHNLSDAPVAVVSGLPLAVDPMAGAAPQKGSDFGSWILLPKRSIIFYKNEHITNGGKE